MMDVTTRNIGQGFAWGTMGAEALQAIQDLRWMIALCVLLIIADYRFGCAESKKRHKDALDAGNHTLAKLWEFRTSRAIRRTTNKFIDYMTLLLVFCIIGLAITEPYGWCDHIMCAGVAMIVACVCELCSVFGHFFYLRGIALPRLTWGNVGLFLGRVIAGFARTKSPDLGEALDETITKTLATHDNDDDNDNKKGGEE